MVTLCFVTGQHLNPDGRSNSSQRHESLFDNNTGTYLALKNHSATNLLAISFKDTQKIKKIRFLDKESRTDEFYASVSVEEETKPSELTNSLEPRYTKSVTGSEDIWVEIEFPQAVEARHLRLTFRRPSDSTSIVIFDLEIYAEEIIPINTAQVNADFNQESRDFLRYEKYNNSHAAQSAINYRAEDYAYMNKIGLNTNIMRVWTAPGLIYDIEAQQYNLTFFDNQLAQISQVTEEILVNPIYASHLKDAKWTEEKYREVLREMLMHFKANFPKVVYVECLNEYDILPKTDGKIMTEEDYYSIYKLYYEVVNEVNAELNPEKPLKVGGPVLSNLFGKTEKMNTFLTNYKNDVNSDKKLDFISYHTYVGLVRGMEISQYANEKAEIAGMLEANNLDENIDIFITETGMFPGSKAGETEYTPTEIAMIQATGMASLAYQYTQMNSGIYPFVWQVRSGGSEKSQFIHDKSKMLTPYGNITKMMSMLKQKSVPSTSNELDSNGLGVYSIATKDVSGVAVMVWNYQCTENQSYDVTISLNNLPENLANKNVKVQTYLMDSQHTSILYTKEENVDILESAEKNIFLEPNTACLVVITPIGEKGLEKSVEFRNELNEISHDLTNVKFLKVNVDIINSTNDNEIVCPVIAIFDHDVLMEIRFYNDLLVLANSFRSVTEDIDLSNAGMNTSAKVFLWDSLEGQKPLTSVTQIPQ